MSRPSCLVYDLYLDTLGGGERVMFAAGEALRADLDVTIAGPRVPSAERLRRFGLPSDLPMRRLHPARYPLATVGVDVVVYLANGVPLPSFAHQSLVFVQFPFEPLSRWPGLRAAQRRTLAGYDVLVYSDFVARWTRRRLGVDSTVVHPPATTGTYVPSAKEPLILAVGRFFDVEHAKRHDVLIEAYRRLPAPTRAVWPLVLAGGVHPGPEGAAYVERLRRLADGENIRFELDVPQDELRGLYSRASLFWHATGFGRREDQPERAEHFGLSTVEAMSHGCVPLVFADGGQLDIVEAGTGVLWTDLDQLVDETQRLTSDPALLRATATRASARAGSFSPATFRTDVRRLVGLRHGA